MVGIADAYTALGYNGQVSVEAGRAKAKEAAEKALALSPDLAEVQSSNAMARLMYDYDFPAAERGFKLALELNPAYVQGAAWYYFFHLGFACQCWEESQSKLLMLQAVEPLSGYIASILSFSYAADEKPREALEWSARALELEPGAFIGLWARQLALHANGDWTAAIDAAEPSLAASGRSPLVLHTLASSHIEKGEMGKCMRCLRGDARAGETRADVSDRIGRRRCRGGRPRASDRVRARRDCATRPATVGVRAMLAAEPRASLHAGVSGNANAVGLSRDVTGAAMSPEANFPEWIEPMAATLTQERFTGADWSFERKFDGIRLIAFKQGDAVRLYSRTRKEKHLPRIAAAVAALPVDDVILDGEVTWDGHTAYHVFDVVWIGWS